MSYFCPAVSPRPDGPYQPSHVPPYVVPAVMDTGKMFIYGIWE
jgi:hypothetical protein